MTPEEIKRRDEARILAIASPVLIPDLERKEQAVINRLIREYRSGATNLGSHIGELAVIRDMIMDIKNKAKQHEGV